MKYWPNSPRSLNVRTRFHKMLPSQCKHLSLLSPKSWYLWQAFVILLKSDGVTLLDRLRGEAIQLTHRESHSRHADIDQRLYHVPSSMICTGKLLNFSKHAFSVQYLSKKRPQSLFLSHNVPSKCKETAAVDFFWHSSFI